MNRWKTIAMMSMGFTCGVVRTAAFGRVSSAQAGISGPSVVVVPKATTGGRGCYAHPQRPDETSAVIKRCCTDLGGEVKGWDDAGAFASPICVY